MPIYRLYRRWSSTSFIYVERFGVSEKIYSYFFAANAVFLLLGPLISSTQMAFGIIGMFIMPLVSGFRIQFLGGAYVITGLISFIGLRILFKKSFIKHMKD